jgi:hypothetical protein
MSERFSKATFFPPVETALAEPNGLLAMGGDLSVERLLEAYRHGIFPWFNPGEPILWWSPDPRMVLVPSEVRVTRSLAKRIRNGGFELRVDTAFADVMNACAAPREGAGGTWIRPAMCGLRPPVRRRLRALDRNLARRPAGRRPLRRGDRPCSTANRCSAASPTPPRSRWCSWRGSSSAGDSA